MSVSPTAVQLRIEGEAIARGLRPLEAAMAGTVLGPADPECYAARRAWRLLLTSSSPPWRRHRRAENIVAIVDFASERDLRVAPHGPPHPHPAWRRPPQ
jgi:hypothetical protein